MEEQVEFYATAGNIDAINSLSQPSIAHATDESLFNAYMLYFDYNSTIANTDHVELISGFHDIISDEFILSTDVGHPSS